MNKKHKTKTLLYKLGGIYLIPHELLHVIAYWFIGKQCQYNLGDYGVRSLQPKNKQEKLFVLLFPVSVCWSLGLLFACLWLLSAFFITIPPERYFIDGPTWHLIFLIIGTLCILYSGTAHKDLIEAYKWLFIYKADYDRPKPKEYPRKDESSRQNP